MTDGKIEKLAVLIDADNAQPSIVDGLLSEIATYGTANVKRIYGDWTLAGLKGWKEVQCGTFLLFSYLLRNVP